VFRKLRYAFMLALAALMWLANEIAERCKGDLQ
jgi:hypothetical protein